jgi:hypothetical protein
MSKYISQLESDARELPARDRARLIRRLIASLDAGEDINAEEQWLKKGPGSIDLKW